MRELKIDLFEPDFKSLVRFRPIPIEGIRIEGPISTEFNGPITAVVTVYLLVKVGDIACGVVSNWLYDTVKNYRAKRVRINGREPRDRDDFEQIIKEEIEIGKND